MSGGEIDRSSVSSTSMASSSSPGQPNLAANGQILYICIAASVSCLLTFFAIAFIRQRYQARKLQKEIFKLNHFIRSGDVCNTRNSVSHNQPEGISRQLNKKDNDQAQSCTVSIDKGKAYIEEKSERDGYISPDQEIEIKFSPINGNEQKGDLEEEKCEENVDNLDDSIPIKRRVRNFTKKSNLTIKIPVVKVEKE